MQHIIHSFLNYFRRRRAPNIYSILPQYRMEFPGCQSKLPPESPVLNSIYHLRFKAKVFSRVRLRRWIRLFGVIRGGAARGRGRVVGDPGSAPKQRNPGLNYR